jgi:hypothetical protein
VEGRVPRFYFNIFDGVSTPDDTGTELADWKEARVEAVRLAGALLKDDAERVALSDEWRLEIADDYGLVLFRFDFISLEAPVLSSQHERPSKPF